MQYTINYFGKPVIVNFMVGNIGDVAPILSNKSRNGRMVTICTLLTTYKDGRKTKISKTLGVAILHEDDTFDLATGMKVSFTDAIKRLDKNKRAELWRGLMPIIKDFTKNKYKPERQKTIEQKQKDNNQ